MTCRCCVGSSCESTDEKTCSEINGECKSSSGCFVTALMDQVVETMGDQDLAALIAGGTYARISDLRDRVLVNSPLGRRALSYNRRFADEALAIVGSDRELFREVGRVFFMAARFSRTLLRIVDGYKNVEPMTITPQMFESARSVCSLVAEKASDDLRRAIEDMLREIEPLVSLTAPEVLHALDFRPSD